MTNQWFRSWHGAPTDPKWLGIARKAGVAPGIVAAVVWALLDRASQATPRGSIAGYDADGLACFMGCEAEQVTQIVCLMHEKGMLENDAFTGWEKHQPKREDDSAKRVQEYRQRKKTISNADVTQCNADERQETLDTDTDTDSECEREGAHTKESELAKEVQGYLDRRADHLTAWEVEFLISIKWADTLSKAQNETLKGIREKLAPRQVAKALPSVRRGTPAYDAWIEHFRKRGQADFYSTRENFTVPTEFPPAEKAA